MKQTDRNAAPEGHKWCGSCKTAKPTSEFGSCKSRPDGLAHRCKVCEREAARRYRERNPEKRKASQAAYEAKAFPLRAAARAKTKEERETERVYRLTLPRACRACHQTLPPSAFRTWTETRADGSTRPMASTHCKECRNEAGKAWRAKNPERAEELRQQGVRRRHERRGQDPAVAAERVRRAALKPRTLQDGSTVKRCSSCHQDKGLESYRRVPGTERLDTVCRACASAASLATYHQSEVVRRTRKDYLQRPYVQVQQAEAKRAWKLSPAGKASAAIYSGRRGGYLKQRALWGREDVEAVYAEAAKSEHVDHIVPVNHPLVCGLHVPENLQILPAKANLSKGNKIPAELAHLFADLPKERVWTR